MALLFHTPAHGPQGLKLAESTCILRSHELYLLVKTTQINFIYYLAYEDGLRVTNRPFKFL